MEEEKPAPLRIPSPPYLTLARAPLAKALSFKRKILYLCLLNVNRRPFTGEHIYSEPELEDFFPRPFST